MASVAIPIYAGLRKFRWLDASLKIMLLVFATAALTEVVGLLELRRIESNFHVYDTYTLIETVGYGMALSIWLSDYLIRRLLFVLISAFSLVWLVAVWIENVVSLSSASLLIGESLILLLASACVLLKASTEIKYRLTENPKFWIAGGVFLYFALNVAVFSVLKAIIADTAVLHDLWVIHSVVNTFVNVMFAAGFLCSSKPTTSFSL